MESMSLRGPFDFPAAIALQAKLARVPVTDPIRIDFSCVADLSCVALAGLAAWLKSSGRRVAVVGLRESELGLLKHLGFSAALQVEAAQAAAAA